MRAYVRELSPLLAHCELTHVAREPIDVARARSEHAQYVAELACLGFAIEFLPPLPTHADGVFVEDTAVLLPEIAILARPGAKSRQAEVDSVTPALARHGPIRQIAAGTLDGGDVLCAGRTLFVGEGGRTDAAGFASFREIAGAHGYEVMPVRLRNCLHLKTAATFIPPDLFVVNPAWVDPAALRAKRLVIVPPEEPFAANTLTHRNLTLVAASAPRLAAQLEALGVRTRAIDIRELQKAEAGLTCLSLLSPESA